jgi:hypothetical protein
VVVSNTPVQATLSLAEPAAVLNVTNTFDLVVTANTAQIDTIQLFTTAGFHSGRTNQPAASFHVSGADLGVGEHAFYAMVTTTNGWRYRTASVPVILVRP